LIAAGAVLLLALGPRLGHLVSLQHGLEHTHLFSTGRVDAAFHLREAREILDDDFWLSDRVPWKGPGYSYFLAGLMWLLGRDPAAFRWALAVLGALNCAGLVVLARRFLSLHGAAVAGSLAALNGVVILFDGELFFPTLLITLNLGIFLLLLRPEGKTPGTAAAGFLLGLAALVHPPYLLVGVGVFAWLIYRQRLRALPFAVAAILTVAPVTLQNVLLHRQPVLISWSGGINFYVGNQPGYDQTSGQGTQAWDRVLQTPLDAGIAGEAERDRLYYGLAARQLTAQPWTAMMILVRKLRVFFSPVEIANNFRIYELRDYSSVLALALGRAGPLWWPFGLWAPLACVGAFLLYRRGTRDQGLLLLWILMLALSCVLFFNTARYRVPVVFFGSIWTAAALEAGWTATRQRDWKRLAPGMAAMAMLLVLTAFLAQPQNSLPPPLENAEALVLEDRGRHKEAGQLHRQLCDSHPGDAGLLLSAAAFHGRRGDQERSRHYLHRALQLPDLGPDDRSTVHESLALSYLVERRLDEAEESLQRALEVAVDAAEWHGVPFFQMELGPVTACRLRIGLAEVELLHGDEQRAMELVEETLSSCAAHGRIAERLERIAPWLAGKPRMEDAP
jgi:tetratricopeptide (TPR) repeat protein